MYILAVPIKDIKTESMLLLRALCDVCLTLRMQGTFTNSKDPDGMPHGAAFYHAAFHLGLHYLFR